MNPARLPRVTGFTLIEMLVVLTVLSLLMIASFGALRLGNRSYEAGLLRSARTEQLRTTGNLLREQFAEIVPLRFAGPDGDLAAFAGSPQEIRFAGPAPRGARAPGLLIYRLLATDDGDRSTLSLSFAPYDPGAREPDPAPAGARVLLDDLDAVAFAFFGAPDDAAADWHASWPATATTLPRLVRVATGGADGEAFGLVFAVSPEVSP